MAEPTVIERMASTYIKSAIGVPLDGLLDSDKICGHMLAAVRELKRIFDGDALVIVLDLVIEEHEKLSKSDKPLSHTNPPSE